ncbi:MAG: UDP-N-acetylglucosamine diphosphorylase/glucosamine-1-phosphate N-acetyltransferase [Candidatus Endolissoclinum sp. TMED37]|nr:MAG: UDP-N-acetylglucosamine diphosphorylase/glucosamine-1-phosphate N-acetyltransferase [Candidatus Endolissoclinum sp. TMED37]
MTVSTIILAAGKGTRMKSPRPKILHKIAGKQLISFSVDLANAVKSRETIVVINEESEHDTREALSENKIKFCLQEKQLGTGDAVKTAIRNLKTKSKYILILYADTPFVKIRTIKRMVSKADKGSEIVFLGFPTQTKNSYGKFKTAEKRKLIDIIEKNEPGYSSLNSLSNSGILLARSNVIGNLIQKIKNDNAKQEYYLTDIVKIAAESGLSSTYVKCEEDECLGINSQIELSIAEKKFQDYLRKKIMATGVSMPSPETCFFSHDTIIKSGCVVEPNVVFGVGVEIRNSTIIRSHSYIEGTQIGRHCQIGPFVRLRPGTHLFDNVKVGNFVEVKNSKLAPDTKANHLSYIGDAEVGTNTNIGAGTIFCNYDGKNKHRTVVGNNVFVGSNVSLIAPLKIGDASIIAAGSSINKDVPSESLAIARPIQQNKIGLGKKIMLKLQTLADKLKR